MSPFTERTINIIKEIPAGRVMTYGQVAGYAGNTRGARQVVRILHSMSEKYNLPWHRIVNVSGRISIKSQEGHSLQKSLLQGEGVVFDEEDAINLSLFQWKPYSG